MNPLGAATFAFRTPPARPEYRDLLLTPANGSWEPAPFNRPNTFVVARSGNVSHEAELARILHGQRNHPDLHNPQTFDVDYARPGQFVVQVGGVSGYGGAALEIALDGRRMLTRDFPDRPEN